jgi:transcriptional regulator GlxA family with amidase domain
MKIRIVVFDGADELDFVGPYEVFRHMTTLGKDIDVKLVTLEHKSEIIAQHGLKVHPDGILDDAAHLVLIPGGGWVCRSAHGIRQEIAHGTLIKRILKLYAKGTLLAGVCTGAMALAAAGLLEKRSATTHHDALNDLRESGAHVVQARVVDDGDILTCGGVTSSLDLAMWIVERFWGMDTAESVAGDLEYSRSLNIHLEAVKG